jgi:SAM-dependent methyltransferase
VSQEIENLIARRLWKVFEFHLPDTPHRVARAMLKELNDNGYTIKKRQHQNESRGEEMKLINSDCIAAMKAMPDNSVDSVVTDPPYELGFMGKKWDSTGIAFNVEVWREALRVLKPGGHLLAFSGSRTYHRMAVAIEDAGFEIRDQIMWIYGSGFPKSLDVSKAIDKAAGAEREVVGYHQNPAKSIYTQGKIELPNKVHLLHPRHRRGKAMARLWHRPQASA